TWNMGWKITLDSATLVNKGMELMEAVWLFGVGEEQIDVIVHPQSILHSAVMFKDGSIIGQMGLPDMRLPIQYALTYPKRLPCPVEKLDFTRLADMSFEAPDEKRFPALGLARVASRMGGTAGAVYNAAGEVAAHRFKAGDIGLMDIPRILEDALLHAENAPMTLEAIENSDAWARQRAAAWRG
nr:1-deoxy-D-xylulose-5-phosphate reductoisomerase [bacterium]